MTKRMSRQEISDRRERRADEVERLTLQGLSTSAIAAALHISTRTVTRARSERGVAQPRPISYTPEFVARVEAMFEDGCSLGEVARTLGVNTGRMSRRWRGRSEWDKSGGAALRELFQQLDAIPAQLSKTTVQKKGAMQ